MTCQKCTGVMVHEKYYEDGDAFMGWRCVNCGDVVDRVILEHREGLGRWDKFKRLCGGRKGVRDNDRRRRV